MDQGYNIIIFYAKYRTSTGIYNLIKISNCDIFIARIMCNNSHMLLEIAESESSICEYYNCV